MSLSVSNMNASLKILFTPGFILAAMAAVLLGLLSTVLYMPNPDFFLQIPSKADKRNGLDLFLVKLLLDLRGANDRLWYGNNSMELARTLKMRASFIQEKQPVEAEFNLRQAHQIEQDFQASNSSIHWQSFLDASETADTADKLANLLQNRGQSEQSLELRTDAYNLIKKNRLYELYPLALRYRELLAARGLKDRAASVSAQIDSWKSLPMQDYKRYVADRQLVFQKEHADVSKGPAFSFWADCYLITGRDLALDEDRLEKALSYYQRCANIEIFSRASNLAELALVYLQLKQYKNAEDTYMNCVQYIYGRRNLNPDVLFVLPQCQGVADLYRLMHKQKDAAISVQKGAEICSFLKELKSQQGRLSADHSWQKGDLVQVYLDELWWSGRVIETHGKKMKVDLIGVDDDPEWFLAEQVRQHPPYGFAALQAQTPESVWSLAAISN